MSRSIHILSILSLASLSLAYHSDSPSNSAKAADATPPSWNIKANVGLTQVSSSTETQSINFLASADRVNPGVDGLHFDAGYFFNKQSTATSSVLTTTADSKFLGGRYDRNISDKLAAYFEARYRQDRPDNIDLRSTYGLGLAYLFKNDSDFKWSFSGGAGYLTERYTDGSNAKQQAILQFGSNLSYNFSKKLSVSHVLTFSPTPSDFSNYYVTSVLQVNYQLSDAFGLNFSNVVDYSSQPPAGSLMKSNTYFLGLSYTSKL